MKKLFFLLITVILASISFAQQQQVVKLSVSENKLELKDLRQESFSAKLMISDLSFESNSSNNGEFSIMEVMGMSRPNNVGQANLPIISKLIEVPYSAEIQVVIKSYSEEVINLSDYGIFRIEPTQPSYSKSTPIEEQFFVIDAEYYNTDELETTPLIKTEISGVMRGVRMGRIEIRPWRYNPVENTLIVYNNLDFEVVFVNADLTLTEEMKSKFYTPEFEGTFKSLLNYMPSAAKDAFSNYAAPIKYVIVANTAFQATLQPFVQWKTKQGYNVIEKYVASGTTNTSIKTYLQGLYTAGTLTDPAPLYVLIIGDHNGNYSVPAFASTASTPSSAHVTDLYFATYDGSSDFLPDLYYGRISANTTTELKNALDKIVPYEKYDIPDGSYLNNCLMIAGVDNNYAKTHGDCTLNYAVTEYFNAAHGFSNIYAYYHTLTSGAYNVMSSTNTGAAASIKSKITSGVGYANYTAHCNYYGWENPAIRSSDITNFNNINKYPFMIGNCCLSFQFNYTTDAFGEQVIYAKDEGAIGYIGTSNSSYWYEDVYWAIGLTSLTLNQTNVTNHNYGNTGLGAFDGAWHENGEAYSDWYYSGSQISQKGNLAVQASSSTYAKYYWEIYHLSGDPSLIPYMTEPSALSLSYTNPMVGSPSIIVTTEPYTYVGLSKNNVLLDAKWSGAGTSVTLTPPTSFAGETYCIVGTKQDRSPYINENIVPIAPFPPVADFIGTPTTILAGHSVSFTDQSQYAASYSWNFGDGTSASSEANPIHVYTAVGVYNVSLTVTNILGTHTETKNAYITVNENTNAPSAQFFASATSILVGATISFTDLSIDNPTSWAWTFEGASPASSNIQNPTGITYPTAGTYAVTLIATNAYGSGTEVKTGYITVTAPIYCDANAQSKDEYISNVTFNTINETSNWSTGGYANNTSISTTVIKGSSYPISVTNAKNYKYDKVIVWIDYNMDGDFTDSGEEAFVGPYTGTSISSPYTWTGSITIPATASEGTTRMRVRLNYDATSYQGNSTPCGQSGYGEVEDYSVKIISSITSSNIEISDDLSIFPNPANESITVSMEGLASGNIKIFNMVGQVVINITPESDVTIININKLDAGVYFVNVAFNGKEYTRKLIVK